MAKYYNAETLLEFVKQNTPNIDGETTMECVERAIKEAPTADVVEVKHGEWKPIVKQDNYLEPPYCETCKCSVCGYDIDVCETVYRYCPNCGAKMEGGKTE